jgi:DNA-binding transcriptional LysR family regulator
MKIDDIDAFVAVVRSQSISQAAKDMGLTQPAITRRVQNLEESLGVELLDRNTKPPKPNTAGKLVYEQCRIVQGGIERLREMVATDAQPAGGLRLGVTQGIGDLVLRGTLEALATYYPELSPRLVTGWGQQLVERVDEGSLDGAAVWLAAHTLLPKNTAGQALGRTRLAVVAPKDEVVKRSYRLAEWHERGWILNPDGCGFRAGLQRALASQGLPLLVRLDTNGRELQLELVARGHGLGLVPLPLLENSAQRDALAIVPLADFKPEIDLCLVYRPTLGRLQAPVDQFGEFVARALK